MGAFYNEIEPYAAEWIENLARARHVADGVVDRRSVRDLRAADLDGYRQAHFFAGIGVWSHALRLAGWPDDVEVWTGSCPCQPFSSAGRRGGTSDDRHLWPAWFDLIRECRPPVVFGEQVASPDGLAWLDAVRADLEGAGYGFGAADLCAAGVGAPHIRQRLYFCGVGLADTDRIAGAQGRPKRGGSDPGGDARAWTGPRGGVGPDCGLGLGHTASRTGDERLRGEPDHDERRQPARAPRERVVAPGASGLVSGFWADAEWLPCLDGVARPVEPGTFPLAHGATARVGRLRAYGNAIVPQVAATFIRAVMESIGGVE